jgi:hypothetical protein
MKSNAKLSIDPPARAFVDTRQGQTTAQLQFSKYSPEICHFSAISASPLLFCYYALEKRHRDAPFVSMFSRLNAKLEQSHTMMPVGLHRTRSLDLWRSDPAKVNCHARAVICPFGQ